MKLLFLFYIYYISKKSMPKMQKFYVLKIYIMFFFYFLRVSAVTFRYYKPLLYFLLQLLWRNKIQSLVDSPKYAAKNWHYVMNNFLLNFHEQKMVVEFNLALFISFDLNEKLLARKRNIRQAILTKAFHFKWKVYLSDRNSAALLDPPLIQAF